MLIWLSQCGLWSGHRGVLHPWSGGDLPFHALPAPPPQLLSCSMVSFFPFKLPPGHHASASVWCLLTSTPASIHLPPPRVTCPEFCSLKTCPLLQIAGSYLATKVLMMEMYWWGSLWEYFLSTWTSLASVHSPQEAESWRVCTHEARCRLCRKGCLDLQICLPLTGLPGPCLDEAALG